MYIIDYNCMVFENDFLIDLRQVILWLDIFYFVEEKVKVIFFVYVIYIVIFVYMILYGRSQGGFKVVGVQLGVGFRRFFRYILFLLGCIVCLVVMFLF